MGAEPYLVRPDSVFKFDHNWAPFIPEGAAIQSRLWSITPNAGGVQVQNETQATVTVRGFTSGWRYELKEHVVFDNGEEESQEIVIRCL